MAVRVARAASLDRGSACIGRQHQHVHARRGPETLADVKTTDDLFDYLRHVSAQARKLLPVTIHPLTLPTLSLPVAPCSQNNQGQVVL